MAKKTMQSYFRLHGLVYKTYGATFWFSGTRTAGVFLFRAFHALKRPKHNKSRACDPSSASHYSNDQQFRLKLPYW